MRDGEQHRPSGDPVAGSRSVDLDRSNAQMLHEDDGSPPELLLGQPSIEAVRPCS
jgi:hypothetical protein